MQNIETARLLIRNFRSTDAARLRQMVLQYSASPYGVYDRPWPKEEEAIQEITDWFAESDQFLAVCLKTNGELIGSIMINLEENGGSREYNLGYIFDANVHGKGYATESCRAVVEHAFLVWEASRLVSGTAAANEPSRRLLERLGFRKISEGMIHFQSAPDGTPYEFLGLDFELTRAAWEQNHAIRDTLRVYYSAEGDERDRQEVQDWKIRERAGFLALLQREQKQTLLEIGAGTGRDSLFFKEQGLTVTCVDLTPAMVALCLKKGLDARVMDIASLAFPEGSFDAVYSMNSLLHLPKAEFPGVLRRVEAIVKPGGLFYIGMYGGIERAGVWENDVKEPKRFFSFFTDAQLEAAARAVFDVVTFTKIDLGEVDGLHFQSLTLKKNSPRRHEVNKEKP